MHDLYTESDLASLNAQIKKRRLLLGLLALLLAVAVIFSLVLDNHKDHRPEALTVVLVAVLAAALIFFHDLTVRPLTAYRKHILSSLRGRTHEVSLTYDRAEDDSSVVEGVTYRSLHFLGEPDKHGARDRVLYWDAELPLPPFVSGQDVLIRYYDRFITSWSEA